MDGKKHDGILPACSGECGITAEAGVASIAEDQGEAFSVSWTAKRYSSTASRQGTSTGQSVEHLTVDVPRERTSSTWPVADWYDG
jgi:hypothetical protein